MKNTKPSQQPLSQSNTKRSPFALADAVSGLSIDEDSGAHTEPCNHLCSDELVDWCRLLRDRRLQQKQKFKLIQIFGSPTKLYAAGDRQLHAIVGSKLRPAQAQATQAELDADLHWLSRPNNHLISWQDSRFPTLLARLTDPPIALFASGDLSLLNDPKVAIVGSRRPTPVGAEMVDQLAGDLARVGLVVTSGMALGIDGLAHESALAANGASIAVLGCGLDIVYPARNRNLYHQLLDQGLVLSEYPLGYKPTRYTFPQRNRIVSGLCYGVIIVEAAKSSGTLITARLALDQDRELFVVPGSALSTQYEGSHQLIKQGASMVTGADDVLYALQANLEQHLSSQQVFAKKRIGRPNEMVEKKQPAKPKRSSQLMADASARLLLRHIGAESTSVNQIICNSGLPAEQVSSLLLMLELDNIIAVDSDGGVVNLT